MNRREFLKGTGLLAAGVLFRGKGTGIPVSSDHAFIRPPGALSEEDFLARCVRCSGCIKVCPQECLSSSPLASGLVALGTPIILTRKAGCVPCGACAKVCPTEAIHLVPREDIKMGTATLYTGECLVWMHQKECLVCLEFCPAGAISKDELERPVVDPVKCIGCGLCEQNCPVQTERAAIRVAPDGQKRYHIRERRYY